MTHWLNRPMAVPARPSLVTLVVALSISGCASPQTGKVREYPDVAPRQPGATAESLRLDASQIKPMYTELLAIDLPTVIRVAGAENLEIRAAAQRVEASSGRLESTVGSVFPAIVPTAVFEHVEGTVRATQGDLVGVGFNSFQVAGLVQWVVNPGKVVYDIVAAKKRLLATEHQERAAILETTRQAAAQFYELVRLQARVSAANQAVAEAQELLRISELRVTTGTGVPADRLRAEARLAERRQDLILALKSFYDASVDLALTLHLDSAVTLVPSIEKLSPQTLVREDLSLEDLLAIAVQYRPDFENARTVIGILAAERGATWWGSFGPQFQAGYQIGGIMGHSNNTAEAEGIPGNLLLNPLSEDGSFSSNPFRNGAIKEIISRGAKRLEGSSDESFGFHGQQRGTAGVGWRFSLSAFGDLKAAQAIEREAIIAAEAQLDQVLAQVVVNQQASRANHELIGLARQQVESAEEALRLTQANLAAGTMTTLDVLQAQDALAQARVRFADAIVRYNQSQVNLLAALGLSQEPPTATSASAVPPSRYNTMSSAIEIDADGHHAHDRRWNARDDNRHELVR